MEIVGRFLIFGDQSPEYFSDTISRDILKKAGDSGSMLESGIQLAHASGGLDVFWDWMDWCWAEHMCVHIFFRGFILLVCK